jgi:hypothetical protein
MVQESMMAFGGEGGEYFLIYFILSKILYFATILLYWVLADYFYFISVDDWKVGYNNEVHFF